MGGERWIYRFLDSAGIEKTKSRTTPPGSLLGHPAGHSYVYNTVPSVSTARSDVHASTLTFPLDPAHFHRREKGMRKKVVLGAGGG